MKERVEKLFSTFMGFSKGMKIVTGIIYVLLCVLIYKACESINEPSPPKTYTYRDIDDLEAEISLYGQSQEDIKVLLKSPSTAEFGPRNSSTNLVQHSDSTIVIISYVDAKNAFGVPIRSEYYCKYKYVSGDPNYRMSYRLVDIKLQ